MSATSNTNTAAAAEPARTGSTGGYLASVYNMFRPSDSSSTRDTSSVDVSTPVINSVTPLHTVSGASASAGKAQEQEDVFEDSVESAPGATSGAPAVTSPLTVVEGGFEDDDPQEYAETGEVDPGFVEMTGLHPLFAMGDEYDYSDMLLTSPIYGANDFAKISGHAIRVGDKNDLIISDPVTHATIATVRNDRFDSGRDLINLSYALVYKEHIPWHYTTAINMAVRQMRINADVALARICPEDAPYRMVYDRALGNARAQKVCSVSLESFVRKDSAKIDVEAMAALVLADGKDATAIYVGSNVWDVFVPDVTELGRAVGKTILYQPSYPFMVQEHLDKYPHLKVITDHPNLGPSKKAHAVLGVVMADDKDLAPGPEDGAAMARLAKLLDASLEGLDMSVALQALLKISRDSNHQIAAPPSLMVATRRNNDNLPAVVPEDNGVQAEIAKGKALITRHDLDALVYAISAGPQNLLNSLKDFGYYSIEDDKAVIFGTFLNGEKKIQASYRRRITSLFKYDKDPIRQAVRLTAILGDMGLADESRAVPMPAAAAVNHMVRAWPQSACKVAYDTKMSLDYEWVFE